MTGATFHHIGIASTDFDADQLALACLDYSPERADVSDELQGVQARFLVGGGPRIELLRDLAGRSAIAQFARKGAPMHHLAYEVDDLQRAAEQLDALGAKQVAAPLPAVGFNMRQICFWMLPNVVLIELISRT